MQWNNAGNATLICVQNCVNSHKCFPPFSRPGYRLWFGFAGSKFARFQPRQPDRPNAPNERETCTQPGEAGRAAQCRAGTSQGGDRTAAARDAAAINCNPVEGAKGSGATQLRLCNCALLPAGGFLHCKRFLTMDSEWHFCYSTCSQVLSKFPPNQVIDFLNQVFSTFDTIIRNHDAYKLETTGEVFQWPFSLKPFL